LLKALAWLGAAAVGMTLVVALWVPRMLAGRIPEAALPSAASTPIASDLAGDQVMAPNHVRAPDFILRDQLGTTISLSQLRGRVVAVTFLDSRCRTWCPIEADTLAVVQHDLGSSSPLVLLVVSVGPEVDTPLSIAGFVRKHAWSGEWHWLMGSRAELSGVWKAYGIEVVATPGDIKHSVALYLVDQRGYERAGFAFLDAPRLERDVRKLAAPGG
jgi:protein SCO1/2